jgi:very-short-patch-repair endonuclease
MANERARQMRREMTEAERKLWWHLRRRDLEGRFRRQVPLGEYIADFACLEARLVIEVDGGQHVEQQTYDTARTAWLESQGFRVLRFWNHEVFTELNNVLETIWLALNPSLESSPARGEDSRDRLGGPKAA